MLVEGVGGLEVLTTSRADVLVAPEGSLRCRGGHGQTGIAREASPSVMGATISGGQGVGLGWPQERLYGELIGDVVAVRERRGRKTQSQACSRRGSDESLEKSRAHPKRRVGGRLGGSGNRREETSKKRQGMSRRGREGRPSLLMHVSTFRSLSSHVQLFEFAALLNVHQNSKSLIHKERGGCCVTPPRPSDTASTRSPDRAARDRLRISNRPAYRPRARTTQQLTTHELLFDDVVKSNSRE